MSVMLKDVAKHAGVAISTVSKVLNNRTTDVKISEATKEKVQASAKELGYRANYIARSLRMQRTSTIGIIVRSGSDISHQLLVAEKYASSKGYELLMAIARFDSACEENEVQRLLHRGIDGLLILSPALDKSRSKNLEKLVDQKFPVVGFGPTLAQSVDYVDWNRAEAFEKLAEHLLAQGCRKLCFVGGEATPGIQQRLDGISQAMQNFPGAELERLEITTTRIDCLPAYLENKFRDNPPHGVLCSADEFAAAAIVAANRIGLNVPGDIAVTGNSNSIFGNLLNVPLTTLEMPYEQMTKMAIKHIIKKIEHPKKSYNRLEKYFSPKIIIRKSSQPFSS